jgi:hypothetical protein
MTKDDIIRMAREAGSIDSEEVVETVYRAFAAAEREACAKLCESCWFIDGTDTANEFAAAIRARSNHAQG